MTQRQFENLEQLLIDLEEYFEGRADADYDWDAESYVPNKAMQFLVHIREVSNSIKQKDLVKEDKPDVIYYIK